MNRLPTCVGGVQRWPRGARVALYTAAVFGTILLMTVCSIGLMMLAGCDEPAAKSAALCSESGRMLIPVGLVIMVAVTIPCLLFLARVVGLRVEDAAAIAEQTSAAEVPESWSADAVRLPLGQHLVSGEVESVSLNLGGYRATVQGLDLRFWGGHALRNGSIRAGDRAAFLYQQVPPLGLKYVLAFWKGRDSSVQSVGALIHTCFFLLGVLGTSLASAQKQGYPAWFIPACGVLFVISTAYLVLLFFAKRVLRDFIRTALQT